MEAARIPFGILPDQDVRVGDHIAYFWQTGKEFEQGVNFLLPGLMRRDYCVVFGHDEANARVCQVLESRRVKVAEYEQRGVLTVVGSHSTGDAGKSGRRIPEGDGSRRHRHSTSGKHWMG